MPRIFTSCCLGNSEVNTDASRSSHSSNSHISARHRIYQHRPESRSERAGFSREVMHDHPLVIERTAYTRPLMNQIMDPGRGSAGYRYDQSSQRRPLCRPMQHSEDESRLQVARPRSKPHDHKLPHTCSYDATRSFFNVFLLIVLRPFISGSFTLKIRSVTRCYDRLRPLFRRFSTTKHGRNTAGGKTTRSWSYTVIYAHLLS